MAAADMAVWRRQNSDSHNVELLMVDGSRLKGALLISRDKTLREFFNTQSEQFVDFECQRDGMIVIAKASIRTVRTEDQQKKGDQAKIDALMARKTELEKTDPYRILGVSANVDEDGLHKAYIKQARAYHPDRFAEMELPPEVLEYINAMCRRINAAHDEISTAFEMGKKRK